MKSKLKKYIIIGILIGFAAIISAYTVYYEYHVGQAPLHTQNVAVSISVPESPQQAALSLVIYVKTPSDDQTTYVTLS